LQLVGEATLPFEGKLGHLRRELPSMLALAGPVVLAELGWMAMGTVDTIMLGRVSREALGGASTAEAVHHSVALFGIGILLGMDTLVAQAFGAKRLDDCDHTLRQGVWLAFLMTPVLMALVALSPALLSRIGVAEDVQREAFAYLWAVNWSTFPLLLYAAFRRYLQGMALVQPIMFALVSANLLNVFGNWVLIYGHLGAPALGTAGSAWATTLARVYMASVLVAYTAWRQRRWKLGPFGGSWAIDLARMRELVALGWPAAIQIGLEVGVFSTAAVLASTLSTIAVAAHHIAINNAAITFMVPLGISSAGAVRVGHAIGARNPAGARHAGWTALGLGLAFMSLTALLFLLVPRWILGIYTKDATLIDVGVTLLYVAAVFQMFDGLQVVATGVLRGLGDTRTPMLVNLAGHWFLGLPVGCLLCFRAGLGVFGLWIGLSIGLIVVSVTLVWTWRRRAAALG
jgi:MATE family multidrug resistance protein